MWDAPISPTTLCEQVAREGEPWGLVPFYDEARGKVFVCELVHGGESRGGIYEDTEGPYRIIASVDDEHPFSAVLANRLQHGETDLAARAREFDRLQALEEKRFEDERDAELRRRWRMRNQLVSLPSGIVNRQVRRAARAIARRARG